MQLADGRRRSPVHPRALTARRLLEEAGGLPVVCPDCDLRATAVIVHDHLRSEHGASPSELVRWLDLTDPDLFALAIHCLAELGGP